MAKIAIKSEKITPFGGIFHVMDHFSSVLEPVIDELPGRRSKLAGYQYGEIIRSLMCVFLKGSCIEDVSSHLMRHLSLHPYYSTCSSDTILRASKMDIDGKTMDDEHIHTEYGIQESVLFQ